MSTAVIKPEVQQQRGVTVREEFTGTQVQTQAETSMEAVKARETALINAYYLVAERHPRHWDRVRVNILSHCKRPRFAEAAKYRKPVGKKQINGEWREQHVEGLSARFAETAAQEATNIAKMAQVTYEDDLIRIVRASVIDLERNIAYSAEVTVAKAVERKGRKKANGEWQAPEGREVISSRPNTSGDIVFLVKATDDELKNKQNSEISKAQRNFVLQLLPADIREEAFDAINATLADPKAVDPAAQKKRVIDGFASIGVMPEDLVTYVGGSLDKISPAQVAELRELFTAIKDGDATFNEALRLRYDAQPEPGEDETKQQHDARLQRQMKEQTAKAVASESAGSTPAPVRSQENPSTVAGERMEAPQTESNEDEMARITRETAEREAQDQAGAKPKRGFGK